MTLSSIGRVVGTAASICLLSACQTEQTDWTPDECTFLGGTLNGTQPFSACRAWSLPGSNYDFFQIQLMPSASTPAWDLKANSVILDMSEPESLSGKITVDRSNCAVAGSECFAALYVGKPLQGEIDVAEIAVDPYGNDDDSSEFSFDATLNLRSADGSTTLTGRLQVAGTVKPDSTSSAGGGGGSSCGSNVDCSAYSQKCDQGPYNGGMAACYCAAACACYNACDSCAQKNAQLAREAGMTACQF